ncbi:MAG: CopG family transcriptional regulator [Streptosporangiaceae bacterium]
MRLQIMLDDDLSEALDRMSAREGVSKAALIRRLVRMAVQPLPPLEDDPLTAMIGADDFEPAPVDDVVYR